jgi:Flp pilus assembly protein TadD
MENYYELLGVEQTATEEEIKDNLKEKKRLWTQRQNAPRPEQRQEAENNLRLVPEIEKTLLNSEKRNNYDQEIKGASQETATAVDTTSMDVEAFISEGWRLIIEGNVADALYLANQARKEHADNPEVWALSAHAKAEWGEIDDAVYEFKQAISLKPNNPEYYYELGGIYENAERWADALKQYQRSAQIAPDRPGYRAAMGSVYIKNEMYNEGIELLEKCVAEEPSNEGFIYLLGAAYTDSAYDDWTYVPDGGYVPQGHYATDKNQVNTAQKYIEKAVQLKVNDSYLSGYIKDVKEDIEAMNKRKFFGNWLVAGIWVVIGVLVTDSATLVGLCIIATAGFYVYASRPAQYTLNKKVINGEAPSGGWDGILWPLLFLPIMAFGNYYKNYISA